MKNNPFNPGLQSLKEQSLYNRILAEDNTPVVYHQKKRNLRSIIALGCLVAILVIAYLR